MLVFHDYDLWLTIAAFLTAIISGLAGMAGGGTLLASMTLFMPLTTIVPIHGVVQLTSNFSRAWILRENIHKQVVLPFIPGAILGGIAAYYVIKALNYPEWILLMIAGLLLYVVFKPKKMPELKLSSSGFGILGLVAATLGALIGATGPLLAPFFIRNDFTKEQIVATKAACQILVHLVKLPVFLSLAFSYESHLGTIGLMVVAVIAGTKTGTWLLGKIETKQFMIIIKWLMFFIACRLIYKTFFL